MMQGFLGLPFNGFGSCILRFKNKSGIDRERNRERDCVCEIETDREIYLNQGQRWALYR